MCHQERDGTNSFLPAMLDGGWLRAETVLPAGTGVSVIALAAVFLLATVILLSFLRGTEDANDTGGTRKARAWPAPYARRVARVMGRAAVTALAGLAVTAAAAATAPALAAQHPVGPATSHPRPATGHNTSTGRMNAHWAHVAAGSGNTCAIRTGGTLWCWGYNINGQLGTGNHTDQDRPQQITTPAVGRMGQHHRRRQLHLRHPGQRHPVVLGPQRQRRARHRQPHQPGPCPSRSPTPAPGDGPASTPAATQLRHPDREHPVVLGRQRPRPARHRQPHPPEPAAAGHHPGSRQGGPASPPGDHTCATRTDGTRGAGAPTTRRPARRRHDSDQYRPRQVSTPAPGGWASVSAGDDHTCATRTDGTLWCWGDNGYGQLGIGNHDRARTCPGRSPPRRRRGWPASPRRRPHLRLRTDGTLWCWGDNDFGQLGIGNYTQRENLPQQVTTPSPHAGGPASTPATARTLAPTRTGFTLWCWGVRTESGGARHRQPL